MVTKDVFYPYEHLDWAFVLSTNPDGRLLRLTREQVNEHLLLVGMIESRKTTIFYNLMATCEAQGCAVPGGDFKNGYRHLVQDLDLLY